MGTSRVRLWNYTTFGFISLFFTCSPGEMRNSHMPRKFLSMKGKPHSTFMANRLTFFGDSILSRKNKVLTTFLFMALWLSEKLHLMGIWVFFVYQQMVGPLGGCLEVW